MTDRGNEEQYQGLTDLINQTAYQPIPEAYGVTAGAGEDGVNQSADSTLSGAGQEGLSPAVGNVPGMPLDNPSDPGVTPPEQQGATGDAPSTPTEPPQPDPTIQQLQETIQNQARYIDMHQQQLVADRRRAAAIEEQKFQESLHDLSEEERRAAIAERRLQQVQAQNQQLLNRSRQTEAQSQEAAKRTLGMIIASEAGIDPIFGKYLMGARTPEEMRGLADDLAQRLTPQQQDQLVQQHHAEQQQQVQQQQPQYQQAPQVQQQQQYQQQQQVDPNAFVAGGENSSGNVAKEIEVGSGDLMGLISQTQYQVSGSRF